MRCTLSSSSDTRIARTRGKTSRRPRRRSRARIGLAILTLALLACGEDGSTDIAPPPTGLVAISPQVDTVSAGERLDPAIAVRVENSVGDPMEGVPVRFLVASGDGRVSPNLAVSNRDGIAQAEYDASSSPGEAAIRVDIPSASQVAPLRFTLVTEPAAVVSLAVLEGDAQTAEVSSQLPLPFRVRAVTPTGSPAGSVPVAWTLVSPRGSSARLSADTAFTGPDGSVDVLLTLGSSPGPHRVSVHAVGGVASDTVVFEAEARERLEGPVRLDSVRPQPLVAGSEARLFGGGFSADPGVNDVRIEGQKAEVLESTTTELRIRVPAFDDRCLPTRQVGVRAIVADQPGNGEMVPLRPRDPPLELDVGAATILRGPGAVECLHLATSDAPSEYRVLVQSAAAAGGSHTLRLQTVTGDEPDAPAFALSAREELAPAAAQAAEAAESGEVRLRASARADLSRRRAVPVRRSTSDSAVSAAIRTSPPATGDTLSYRFAVGSEFTASCADTTSRIQGIVRAVGDHVVLVEDAQAPPGGFEPEDWDRLAAEIDDVVFPTDTAYFGAPADIDGNGRVVLLFTPEVNRLNAPGAATGIGGFFLSLDLAASGRGSGGGLSGPGGEACPASNEAEILYLLTPDPEGRVGEAVGVARARRNALGISAHELQHLINAERRVLAGEEGFDALEETWLDEGLSHLAEEVVGLRMADLGPGRNLSYADVTTSREELDLFNAFHINNFFQLALYMLNPSEAPTLATSDPGGLGGLQMRGFAWFLLRWAADEVGGDDRVLFRELAGGGPRRLQGVANLERATGRSWPDLLAEFSAALAVDDAGVEGLAGALRITSWDFRDVFSSLNQNPAASGRFPLPFPLALTSLRVESTALEFSLGAGTSRYFSIAPAPGQPPLALGFTDPTGGVLPESMAPQVTVVRIR